MRITYISTFPPIECGIGFYTQYLVDAMRKTPNQINVISQYGAMGTDVHPTYDITDGDMGKKIVDLVHKLTPDVVHLQHEFGLYGETHGIAILDIIYRLKTMEIPIVFTLHTVRPELAPTQNMIFDVIMREADGIIVHESEHLDILKNNHHADPAKLHLIPHGAREMTPLPDAKEKLNLTNKKVILLVGYFRPSKGFDKIVELFPEIVKNVPDAWLVISGKLRRTNYTDYRELLFEKINRSPVKDRIEVFRGQFPQRTFDHIVSAGDVVVFPYELGAQSGVMAHAFSFGRPVVTSDLPAFKAILDTSRAGLYAKTDAEYIETISRILGDDTLAARFSDNAFKYVKESISWDIVAQKTLKVYSDFEPTLECKTRYVYLGT